MIDPQQVEAAFVDSLAGHEDGLIIEGVVDSVSFDPDKLETHREEVIGWIKELPTEFLPADEGGDGGWTFLNLCVDRETGDIWTGLHLHCGQLYQLAAGLGLAKFLLPREMWAMLPGNVPYIEFSTRNKA